MITTYPSAANSSAFQRYDHSSPHCPCGPPWIRNLTGYFWAWLKFGGLSRKPWTFTPAEPANQKGSTGCMAIFPRTASFMGLSCSARYFDLYAMRFDGPLLAGALLCA